MNAQRREYVFPIRVTPSPSEHVYPREANDGITERVVQQRRDGRHVIVWQFTPTVKGVK